MAWLHLAAYSKTQEKRNNLKTEWLSKKEVELHDLENFLPRRIAKNENIKDTGK